LDKPARVRSRRRRNGRSVPATDARALAWEILQRVEAGGYADALLGGRLARRTLSGRDQALLTRLVYGTLAWQAYLDHIVAACAGRPPADLDPPVRTVLRLALFQMCVLTKIPDFAAVDTAVQLAKRFRGGSAVSLVNAVLRRAATGWRQVRLPSSETDLVGHLAIQLSHPRWLVEQWLVRYGVSETTALLQANNEPAPTVLRVNRRRMDTPRLLAQLRAGGSAAAATAYSPVGVQLEAGGAPEALPGYTDGCFSVQGEAAQLVGFLVGPRPGERVLDACAAPGGKTTHLAELMDDRGEVLALDVQARGVERIERMTRRLGLSSVTAVVADATAWPASSGQTDGFDRVLVDAPCSGLGTLRQHPEIKWRRRPDDLAAMAGLQQRLLRSVAPCVRGGGTLVYAVCTLGARENEDVVSVFLQTHPEFRVDDPRALLPASAQALVGADGALRTFPHRHGLDGFFAVRLKRRAAHGIVGE
jgi:16S rRNA (cytosine967-C5)-methyltransferase